MSDVDDLAVWLGQIWDEDKAQAEAAGKAEGDPVWSDGGPYSDNVITDSGGAVAYGSWGGLGDATRGFIARHDPASVLARIAADRKILELMEYAYDDATYRYVVKLLGSAYADRPGYQEAWKP